MKTRSFLQFFYAGFHGDLRRFLPGAVPPVGALVSLFDGPKMGIVYEEVGIMGQF